MLDPRPPGLKWNYLDPDVLPAWVAEMDFGLAPAVIDALHAAVDRGDTGYLYPAALDAVASNAAGFWADRLAWHVRPEQVSHAPDVIEGLRRVIMMLTAPDSPVIVPTPAYFPFFSMVDRAGRERIDVPSIRSAEGRWELDLDAIDEAFRSGAGSVVLCNPWNPVGRSLTATEIRAVIEIASAQGGRVLADEVHAPITYPELTHTVAATIDPHTVVTVTAASKAWNIPGLKAAQVILTNQSDLQKWSDYYTPEKLGVGTFGLFGSAAAYADGVEWFDGVLGVLDANRRLLSGLIHELLPDAIYRPSEATYLAWIDLSAYIPEKPAEYLLEHARVGASEGSEFGAGGEGHIRFNFATRGDLLVEMLERVAKALR